MVFNTSNKIFTIYNKNAQYKDLYKWINNNTDANWSLTTTKRKFVELLKRARNPKQTINDINPTAGKYAIKIAKQLDSAMNNIKNHGLFVYDNDINMHSNNDNNNNNSVDNLNKCII